MYKQLFLALILSLSLVSAMESGLNYYDSFENSLNIPSPNKTYQLAFLMDDIGTCANPPTIADIDNDGVNELIIPEYSGRLRVWNWTGMKMGLREGIDSDRGYHYLATSKNLATTPVDNNGNGYLDMIFNDYNGYLRVVEYDGSSFTTIYDEPSDRGNYRNSPTYCDIDNDGDYDIFTCSYDGKCRLYLYSGGTYTLSFTDIDRGTYNYDDTPICEDIDNDGDKDLVINDYEGRINIYNWSGSALSWVAETSDVGSYYAKSYVGDFLGNGNNYMIACSTSGICYAYNCSAGLTSCVTMDSSNDIGSFSYGAGDFRKIRISGKDYLIGEETYGKLVLVELEDATTITITQKGKDIDYQTNSNIGLANTSTGYDYILRVTKYTSDVAIDKYQGGTDWDTVSYQKNIQNKYFSGAYANGFLDLSGFTCGQLDYSTPEDECIALTYEGIPYVYTYQNITEYHQKVNSDYELSYLDIMPRDATQYLVKGNANTYCVNEQRNILKESLGGGKINSWANVYDDEGSAISNYQRITDGVLSTHQRIHNQNGVDYTSWDAGTDQYINFNMSKAVQLGELEFWGYFSDGRDPLNLRIQISDTNCDSPNFVTVFNESDGDITGAGTSQGLKVRFTPQDVSCIRITADGYYQAGDSKGTSNVITELKGYYANNCTFYTVPLDFLNSNIGDNYNTSIEVFPNSKETSINQLQDQSQGAIQDIKSFILEVISRTIIWIQKY